MRHRGDRVDGGGASAIEPTLRTPCRVSVIVGNDGWETAPLTRGFRSRTRPRPRRAQGGGDRHRPRLRAVYVGLHRRTEGRHALSPTRLDVHPLVCGFARSGPMTSSPPSRAAPFRPVGVRPTRIGQRGRDRGPRPGGPGVLRRRARLVRRARDDHDLVLGPVRPDAPHPSRSRAGSTSAAPDRGLRRGGLPDAGAPQAARPAPQGRLWNLYGPTETNVCTYYRVAELPPDHVPIPIGRACENVEVYALTEDGRVAGVGQEGELYVRGGSVMNGYRQRPEKTAEVIPIPVRTRAGRPLVSDGDLVRLRPDGNYDFLGRRDHQVKSRGFRIELGDVEAALGADPGLLESAVVATPHPDWGTALVAWVVPKDGSATTPPRCGGTSRSCSRDTWCRRGSRSWTPSPGPRTARSTANGYWPVPRKRWWADRRRPTVRDSPRIVEATPDRETGPSFASSRSSRSAASPGGSRSASRSPRWARVERCASSGTSPTGRVPGSASMPTFHRVRGHTPPCW